MSSDEKDKKKRSETITTITTFKQLHKPVDCYTRFYGFRIINATFYIKGTNQSAVDDAHNTCGHQDSPEVQTCD